jgi:hypothetical protein
MNGRGSCARSGREAEEGLSHNWLRVRARHKPEGGEAECGEKYCDDCGEGDGTIRPQCGFSGGLNYDKVYTG